MEKTKKAKYEFVKPGGTAMFKDKKYRVRWISAQSYNVTKLRIQT